MSKRVNNIFNEKLKFNCMLKAYYRAAAGKPGHKEIIEFDFDLASNIVALLKSIKDGTYKISEYRRFKVYIPKERIVEALPFKDRVVHQWYVEELIKPIFLPKFISDSYACIEGRGVHSAVKKMKEYYKIMYKKNSGKFYILYCDISGFFYNIDRKILYGIIERKIKDKEFLEFTKNMIFDSDQNIGIPIGNYTSQYFANIYLNELDHYIKEKLRVKYYIRYMDDFVMLLDTKGQAKEYKQEIENFLKNRLNLKLNTKSGYFKSNQGVNFCGYKVFYNKILVKKDNKQRIYKRVRKWNKLYKNKKLDLKKAYKSLAAWRGHVMHSDSKGLIETINKKCDFIYNEELMYARYEDEKSRQG